MKKAMLIPHTCAHGHERQHAHTCILVYTCSRQVRITCRKQPLPDCQAELCYDSNTVTNDEGQGPLLHLWMEQWYIHNNSPRYWNGQWLIIYTARTRLLKLYPIMHYKSCTTEYPLLQSKSHILVMLKNTQQELCCYRIYPVIQSRHQFTHIPSDMLPNALLINSKSQVAEIPNATMIYNESHVITVYPMVQYATEENKWSFCFEHTVTQTHILKM